MSIASEITRISNAKSSIASAITAKGVTVPSGTLLDGMPTLIGQIQTGITPSGNKALTPSTSAQTGIDVSTYATASVDAITKELLATLDADFVAANIKKDVDLFGLVGTLAGGGGEIELPPGWTYDYGTITLADDQTKTESIYLTKGYMQAGSVNQNNFIALIFSPEVMSSDFNSKVLCFRGKIANQSNWDVYRDAYINGSGTFEAKNYGDIIYYNNNRIIASRIAISYVSTRKLKAGRKYYGLVFGEALT